MSRDRTFSDNYTQLEVDAKKRYLFCLLLRLAIASTRMYHAHLRFVHGFLHAKREVCTYFGYQLIQRGKHHRYINQLDNQQNNHRCYPLLKKRYQSFSLICQKLVSSKDRSFLQATEKNGFCREWSVCIKQKTCSLLKCKTFCACSIQLCIHVTE